MAVEKVWHMDLCAKSYFHEWGGRLPGKKKKKKKKAKGPKRGASSYD